MWSAEAPDGQGTILNGREPRQAFHIVESIAAFCGNGPCPKQANFSLKHQQEVAPTFTLVFCALIFPFFKINYSFCSILTLLFKTILYFIFSCLLAFIENTFEIKAEGRSSTLERSRKKRGVGEQ